jgi:hypothetical protein
MKQILGTQKDFRGVELCDACWNGYHYVTDHISRKKTSNCLGGGGAAVLVLSC